MPRATNRFHEHSSELSPAAFSVEQAAMYISISRASVWRLLQEGQLRRTRIRGRTVIRRIDLDQFMAKCAESA
jgi:excisionase family DNA binding protein